MVIPVLSSLIKYLSFFIFFLFVNLSLLFASQNLEFNSDDKILVLSPHPDDETIGTAGIIQSAISAGAQVQVVCYTNGDNNEFAFIVYEKRITFRKGEFIYMGKVRAKETMEAMKYLGVKKDNIKFLGYPDFGTMEILTKYWDNKKPYRSMLARINKVYYQDALSNGAPFTGVSILNDLKKIILDFKPTKIFVSHPADTNRDHQALYLFTKIALLDLVDQFNSAQVFSYIIHIVGWPHPRGHHTTLGMNPPEELDEINWQKFNLKKEQILKKQKAISYHKSQIECNPPYLFTFARKNELLGDFPQIFLKKQLDSDNIQWQFISSNRKNASSVAYAVDNQNLLVKLPLTQLDKNLGITLNILPYSKSKEFSLMPKFLFKLGVIGVSVKDKTKKIKLSGVKIIYKKIKSKKVVILKIPLENIGNPDYIFCRIKKNLVKLPIDITAWRILKIQSNVSN